VTSNEEKFSGKNTQYAGLALGWGWLKTSKLLRFLNRLRLDLKTVKRTPKSKLEDLLACLMAGVESLGRIDVGMRRDPGLIAALGRESLADQSLISQTLDAFGEKSLSKLRWNIRALLREESRALARIRKGRAAVLDLDMTDLPCSRRCEGALKGRTTARRGATVRQLSIVYNHLHREPLDVFLHAGNVNSAAPLQDIVLSLEQAYEWDRPVRQGITWRLDSGYGSDRKLSWLMRRGYKVLAKGYSNRRAAKWGLAAPAQQWKRVGDTQDVFERGRIPAVTSPHRCLVIRTLRTKVSGYAYSYLAGNLDKWVRPRGHVLFYNERQGIEKEIQQIKSVLGLKHKRKRSFDGMQALALMTLMANLMLVWYRRSLGLEELGIKRFLREVVQTPGFVVRNGRRLQIVVEPQAKHYQRLNEWKPQVVLPLYFSQSGGILYKN